MSGYDDVLVSRDHVTVHVLCTMCLHVTPVMQAADARRSGACPVCGRRATCPLRGDDPAPTRAALHTLSGLRESRDVGSVAAGVVSTLRAELCPADISNASAMQQLIQRLTMVFVAAGITATMPAGVELASWLHSVREELPDDAAADAAAAPLDSRTPRAASSAAVASLYTTTLRSLPGDVPRRVFLTLGTQVFDTVPAAFGPAIGRGELPSKLKHAMARAEPATMQRLENREQLHERIVLSKRGGISFAVKGNLAAEAHAAALVVVQTASLWPFVMQDSAAQCAQTSVPIVMVSQADGARIQAALDAAAAGEHSAEPGSLACTLQAAPADDACAVCMAEWAVGDEVSAMPCGHAFHAACLLPWLRQVSSCPLCRAAIQSAAEAGEAQPGQADGMSELGPMGMAIPAEVMRMLNSMMTEQASESGPGYDAPAGALGMYA